MKTRIIVLGLLVAIMSVTAFGAGFLGTPTAELEKGQWSVGYSYMFSSVDFKETVLPLLTFQNGVQQGEADPIDSQFVDVQTSRHYATFGHGLLDWLEVSVQLGGASVKAKEDTMGETYEIDFDNDFAWGWGTKVTFLEQESMSWGASLQMNWLDTSSESDWGGTGSETYSFDTMDMLIAVGPTIDMDTWKLYGGAFYYDVSGDSTWGAQDGSLSMTQSGDIEADSNFGGFIGAQFPIGDNANWTAELSFTGDSWALGFGIGWQF